jgi:hypothetical protein
VVVIVIAVADFDFYAHPGMNAALEVVIAFARLATCSELPWRMRALLREVLESFGTFRDRCFAGIQSRNKAAELLHFGESVRFAALVGNDNRSAFLILTVSGSKSQLGSGWPLRAESNSLSSGVNAPSVTFLQKSAPSAALKLDGSHSSSATI